ncbi:asparagine synthase-related protein [Streptomyces mayteni]
MGGQNVDDLAGAPGPPAVAGIPLAGLLSGGPQLDETLPPLDEPAPATVTAAFFTHHLRHLAEFGSDAHLTGDGGDTLLTPPLANLADLARRHPARAARQATGWATLLRTSPAHLLHDLAASRTITRPGALRRAATELTGGRRPRTSLTGWIPAGPAPACAAKETAELVAASLTTSAAADHQPDPGHAATWLMLEQIREVARTAAADAQLAHAAAGVRLHNPFLDPAVVAAVLSAPAHTYASPHTYKPLLTALPGLLPPIIAGHTTKGDSTSDHIRGLRANLPTLLDLVDGELATLGLIEPAALEETLGRAAAGIPGHADQIEPVLAHELWLRSLTTAPPTTWQPRPPSRCSSGARWGGGAGW